MKWYLVSMQGQNLVLNYKGDIGKYGFHTKRYVQAADEQEAESAALDKLMKDPELHEIVMNKEEDPPSISVEEIQEVGRPKEVKDSDVKNLFYKEHEA